MFGGIPVIELSVMTQPQSIAVLTDTLSAVTQASTVQRYEVATFQDQISIRTEAQRVEVFG